MDWMSVIWFCLAIAFLIIEIISFTLWALFFALSSFIVWFLTYCGILISVEYQLISFASFSLLFIFLLKNKLKKITRSNGENIDDSVVGKSVTCLENFYSDNNFEGKVEYNGSHWKARSEEVLEKNDKAFIKNRDNITLIISKNKGE